LEEISIPTIRAIKLFAGERIGPTDLLNKTWSSKFSQEQSEIKNAKRIDSKCIT
jgi:hypothetical protein